MPGAVEAVPEMLRQTNDVITFCLKELHKRIFREILFLFEIDVTNDR